MIRKEIEDVRVLLAHAVNHIYLGKLYEKHWSSNFAWEQATGILKQIEDETSKIDIRSLSKEELEVLGFPKWNEGSYAIPAYFHRAAVEQGYMKEEDDTDTRMGALFCFLSPSK